MRKGIPTQIARTIAGVALLAVASPFASAADSDAASATAPDKSGYWLFNPTPDDQLRGMDTDRPNKTNTPHTIDAGHVQVEAGFFDYVHYRNQYQGANSSTDALAIGHVNLRLGVLNNAEVNLAFDADDFLWSKDYLAHQSSRAQGFGDVTIGGKLNLWGDDGGDDAWSTAFALQPQLKIPTARHDIGNGHPELAVGAPLLLNLPAEFHLSFQTTGSWERNSAKTGYVAGWQNSASLDRVVFDALDLYLEYWMHTSTERHLEAQQTVDLGFIYALTDNLTLDAGTNIGLNKATNTVEFLSGMSLRF